MSDPDAPEHDLRYVLVDTAGMVDGDLVQYEEGRFVKFTPQADWTVLDLPTDWANINEIFPSADNPAFALRQDGFGGVSIRGVVGGVGADIIDVLDEASMFIVAEDVPEEFRPAGRQIVSMTIVVLHTELSEIDGMYSGLFQMTEDGTIGLQCFLPTGHADWDDALVLFNLNGRYDRLI